MAARVRRTSRRVAVLVNALRRVSREVVEMLLTDEDGTPCKARGTVAGKTLTVDLGGAALVGVWNGLGIVFSDGNTWTKK